MLMREGVLPKLVETLSAPRAFARSTRVAGTHPELARYQIDFLDLQPLIFIGLIFRPMTYPLLDNRACLKDGVLAVAPYRRGTMPLLPRGPPPGPVPFG